MDLTEFGKCRQKCFTSMKAYQNLRAAALALERLCNLVSSKDELILAAVFHSAVIRYAKPFLASNIEGGKVTYPSKHLKSIKGFIPDVHEHLLAVRNTLVAHDDFLEIEPSLLYLGFTPDNSEIMIPTSVVVSNKCIGHPADLAGAQKLHQHAMAAFQGAHQKLFEDISEARAILLANPDEHKKAQYSKNCGSQHIPVGGTSMNAPDVSDNEWLDNDEPDFSTVHSGYRYESLRARVDFHGPEEIKLEDGRTFVLTPNT
jgi:hypothetical protein